MLSVIMPVYNEKNTLRQAYEKIQCLPMEKEIVLVDDFSTDGTREILKGLRADNVVIIYHARNMGKGAAIRTALTSVSGDIVIIQDADLEYNPEEIPGLIRPIEEGRLDVVYGSRFLGEHERKYFSPLYLGNRFFSLLTAALFFRPITDMETCYKAMRTGVIKSFILRSNRFDIEPEITAKILKRNFRFKEIPISYKGRSYAEGKKISWKDGLVAILTLFKYRFVD